MSTNGGLPYCSPRKGARNSAGSMMRVGQPERLKSNPRQLAVSIDDNQDLIQFPQLEM
jgi:hypothetical protein